jgi:hypothetical protein
MKVKICSIKTLKLVLLACLLLFTIKHLSSIIQQSVLLYLNSESNVQLKAFESKKAALLKKGKV